MVFYQWYIKSPRPESSTVNCCSSAWARIGLDCQDHQYVIVWRAINRGVVLFKPHGFPWNFLRNLRDSQLDLQGLPHIDKFAQGRKHLIEFLYHLIYKFVIVNCFLVCGGFKRCITQQFQKQAAALKIRAN